MATYKFRHLLSPDQSIKFDESHEPGVSAPYPGIYKCEKCGREIAIAQGRTLPPEHPHKIGQGKVRWRLVVSHD